MRKGKFLVTRQDGSQAIYDFKLEHNMYFHKSEAIKWMKEKHNARSVTYVSEKTYRDEYAHLEG